MKIILISGDGHGAGKTFLARKLTDSQQQIFSIVNLIRRELAKKYPSYDWYNKDPAFKLGTIVKETGKSVHQMLDTTGRERKVKDPLFWAKGLVDLLKYARDSDKLDTIVVDDVRFVDECDHLRSVFATENILHLHVVNPKASLEPSYQNALLKAQADFHISRGN